MASRLRYLRAPLAADVLGGAQLPSRLAKTETHAFAGEMTATDVAPHPQVDRSAASSARAPAQRASAMREGDARSTPAAAGAVRSPRRHGPPRRAARLPVR